jgi:hypothetical protein
MKGRNAVKESSGRFDGEARNQGVSIEDMDERYVIDIRPYMRKCFSRWLLGCEGPRRVILSKKKRLGY